MPTYDKPSEAWKAIPKGALARVRQSTGGAGRPFEMAKPDGTLDWDETSFNAALADGTLPRNKYILRPIVGGKISHKRVSLDLSISDETTTIEGMPGSGAELATQPIVQGYFVQEKVIEALMTVYQDERTSSVELRDEVKELFQENIDLKMKVADLEHKLERASDNDSLPVMFNKFCIELAKGPGGIMMLQKVFGGSDFSAMAAEAMKKAA